VEDPKRLIQAILCCSFALALWPSQAAAQRHGHPARPAGSSVVVVRPAFYGGYPEAGFTTSRATVRVRGNETVALNVSLPK
jgi:hypothetical protein